MVGQLVCLLYPEHSTSEQFTMFNIPRQEEVQRSEKQRQERQEQERLRRLNEEKEKERQRQLEQRKKEVERERIEKQKLEMERLRQKETQRKAEEEAAGIRVREPLTLLVWNAVQGASYVHGNNTQIEKCLEKGNVILVCRGSKITGTPLHS